MGYADSGGGDRWHRPTCRFEHGVVCERRMGDSACVPELADYFATFVVYSSCYLAPGDDLVLVPETSTLL